MDIKTQKMLADVVLNAKNKTVQPYTTTAIVKSVNDNTIYVEIPGSDRATPVKNSTVSVKKGDVVDLVVSHNDTHITGNRSDVATSQTETSQISNTVTKTAQAMEATRLEMDNKLDLVGNEIVALNNSVTMQGNKIEMLGSDITVANSTIEAQNSKIETINSQISTIGSTISTIESTIETQSSDIVTLDSKISTQISTIETLNSKINTQDSKINTLSSTVSTQGSAINSISSTIETLNSTVESQGSAIIMLGSTVETLNSTVETMNSTVKTLNSTVETQNSAIQTLDSNVKIIGSAFQVKDGTLTGISEILTNILKTDYAEVNLLNVNNAWIVDGKIKEGAIGTTEIADASITTAKIDELSADVIKTGTLRTERLLLTTDEIDPETGEKKVALITALNAKVNDGEGNILDGAVIADDTIEASKINVVDLNAFEATIGNFHIGTSSMYNGKESLTDPTNGVYLGTDGIALGQGSLLGMTDDSPFRVESDGDFHLGCKDNNYINFDPFTGALDINAKTIKMGSKTMTEIANDCVDDLEIGSRNLILDSETLASDKHELSVNVLTYKGALLTYKGNLLTR